MVQNKRKLYFSNACLVVLLFVASGRLAAQSAPGSQLFEAYRQNKQQSPLPDFSYAGYHSGEKAIPDIRNYKVFNVLDFGAKPNDDISDREAIQQAINAANKNGLGIVFFPKGRFIVNDDSTLEKGIICKGDNIILRGSGSGSNGTELFMKEPLVPVNPDQMWTGRPMFTVTANGRDQEIGKVKEPAAVGAMELTLNTTTDIKVGDWVALKMLNNDAVLVNQELAPHKPDSSWKYIVKEGVDVCVYYQVAQVKKNTIRLHAPLAYPVDPKYGWTVYQFAHANEVGIEDIAFVGNWKETFVHHKSWKHDSGFNLFLFSRCTNSWMRNCRFTDCNIGAIVNQSANVTVMDCVVTGNAGHEAISSTHSTNVLLANLKDEASQWHSFGSSHGAVNTVIWHCSYPATTCFESHASQPRNTLLDNVTGGFMPGRQGGAIENLPNHLAGLVLWNYTQTSAPVKDFDFWPKDDVWFKMVNPIVVGFTCNGSSFKKDQAGYFESIGQNVAPASLYEAQLELRLKKIPSWLKKRKALCCCL
ncbi:DUF4955 domain-containing protein [Chitinophagaceae bacterium LB-8]|uniref:DUF4955 domain-containing protein n=1 Tax=Paraflavisolibacter caeni TaxID=2982496 RepID=A0A9X2XU38_9BACT|nr:DUF4955 domain-containing protein [Paraflavisolibacter caeni]MCU7549244.1 DUF4955 domain-containing protein [Paraflavisolibacter caeni]